MNMQTSLIDTDSLLAIDVGEVNTRTMLSDVVDGRYRFLASSSAPTTANAPYNDIWEGIRIAIDRLQSITGRTLVGDDEQLICPSQSDGAGVDKIVATISAGQPIKVVVLGLLEDVSLESARRLARTTYAQVLESIGLNDRRKLEARISALQRLQPDLIIVAGGTENGAMHSVEKIFETVGLANYLLPVKQRPEILFAGNQALTSEVSKSLGMAGSVHIAPNVRPSIEVENLDAAQIHLSGIFRRIRSRQIPGVSDLDNRTGGGLMPTAMALGRIIRFLSKVYNSNKGVLGVDIGASSTSLAASISGRLTLNTFPEFGIGVRLVEVLNRCPITDITRWLQMDIPERFVREYMYHKTLYPATIPASIEDIDIEHALARQMMRLAVRSFDACIHEKKVVDSGMVVGLEPILALGSVLTQSPKPADSILMLLDGLQPVGVTTLVLDQHHILPMLGVAAAVNPSLVIHVLESGTLLNLGTVISPYGNARFGTPILHVRMTPESGNDINLDIRQGSLTVVPLPTGQSAQLVLKPLHRFDVGMGGPGRGGNVRVTGGAMGMVIDARGRPLRLASDPMRRRELYAKWQKALNR